MNPSFNNPIPRGHLPNNREASRLQSPRESGGLFRSWQRAQDSRDRADSVTSAISQLQRQVSRLAQPNQSLSGLHPFKIYQFPSYLRNFHPTDEWQRVKIRFGGVVQDAYENTSGLWTGIGSIPLGCDNQGSYPAFASTTFSSPFDEQFLCPNETQPNDKTSIASNWHEAVIPNDGKIYAIWISMCGNAMGLGSAGTPVICYGTSPTGCTEMYTGTTVNDPWPTWTSTGSGMVTNDPYHFLIGYAQASNGVLTTWQLLGGDVFFYGFGQRLNGSADYGVRTYLRFMGEWHTELHYYIGDIVTVTGATFITKYLFWPKSLGDGGSYWYGNGPIQGLSPGGANTPEPWLYFGKYPTDPTKTWTLI